MTGCVKSVDLYVNDKYWTAIFTKAVVFRTELIVNIACSRLQEGGERANGENEHKKRVGAGQPLPLPFPKITRVSFSCSLSNVRAVLTF